MMKTLIAYATKTGTARSCALILAELLPGSKLCDLSKELPDPAPFDAVVVGGSIRMGTLHADAQRFLRKYRTTLLTKRTAYFLCNCAADKTAEFFQQNLPQDLREAALCLESFGGELDLSKQKGFDRMAVKMMLQAQQTGGAQAQAVGEMRVGIREDRIAALARTVKDARP